MIGNVKRAVSVDIFAALSTFVIVPGTLTSIETVPFSIASGPSSHNR